MAELITKENGYPCPACGFLTIGESMFGSYNICPICNWEDDAVQLANPASGGGANREPLIDYQDWAIKAYPLTTKEARGYARDPLWRPLNAEERKRAESERARQRWTNRAVMSYDEAYWVVA